MSYATIAIGNLMEDVNRKYFLPAIQRPFVWGPDHIVTLIDSLMKGYPINSFMFWSVDGDLKKELKTYKFIDTFRPDMRNPAASADGREILLVLDGQQRMTSLLIALRGTFSEKTKFKRRVNADAWSNNVLYLDLLKDPEDEQDSDEIDLGVSYGLRFLSPKPRNDYRHHWFRLGDILNYPHETDLEGLIQETRAKLHHGIRPYEHDLVAKTLRRLHRVIWIDEAINYFTETSSSIDRVLDIFVRANDGGVKLSKSDLLMSMITSRWEDGMARDKVFAFVDSINTGLLLPNKITKDFVLKASLTLCGYDVRYNVSNFTAQAVADIERNWPAIKDAIERTFRFLNGRGISAQNLPSLNAVLPIACYLYNAPDVTLRGTSNFDRQNGRAVQRWLVNTLLMSVFAGNSDRTIAAARATLQEAGRTSRNFPETQLYHALAIGGRITQLDERAIEDLMKSGYGKSKTVLVLSLIYDDLDWGGTQYHADHIIPKAHATRRILMGTNLSEHRIREITASVDRIGNLQLLSAQENQTKHALPFEAWITSRNDHYGDEHLIDHTPDLWTAQMLPEFVRHRESLIRQRLLAQTEQVGESRQGDGRTK